MPSRAATIFVIVVFSAVVSPFARVAAAQQIDPIVDPEAYQIFSDLIPRAWAGISKRELVLQRETTLDSVCEGSVALDDPEWVMARNDFREQNARTRLLLQPMLSLAVPYRVIARSEIEADDARLALKYPGLWQRRPESMEFVAVSEIGFNAARTKAIAYVRSRSRGGVTFLERREGEWVRASIDPCAWIA